MNTGSAPQQEKQVFAAYTNTDLTEGRGCERLLVICELKATALRIGRKKHVQGGDCPVRPLTLYRHGNLWYGPVQVEQSTDADKKLEADAQNLASVLEKAKSLGLSEADIATLARR